EDGDDGALALHAGPLQRLRPTGPDRAPTPHRLAGPCMGPGSDAAPYAFGHDDVAARRLCMVHDVLAPATGALLREVAGLGPFRVAVDLGCGPGPTSRLIDEVLHPTRLVG